MSALSAAAQDEDGDITKTLQARVADLEAQLYAVGAGGVGSLVARQNPSEQHLNMVPAGWKLVPVEPTLEMIKKMCAYDGTEYSNPFDSDDFKDDYRNMLAAAPQPPALEQSQPKREPIPNVMMDLGWELHGSNDPYQSWCMAVEWTERAHGIGGEA